MPIAKPRVMVVHATTLLFLMLILAIISALGIPIISTVARWTLIAVAAGSVILFAFMLLSFLGLYLVLRKLKNPHRTYRQQHGEARPVKRTVSSADEQYTPAKGERIVDATVTEKKPARKVKDTQRKPAKKNDAS